MWGEQPRAGSGKIVKKQPKPPKPPKDNNTGCLDFFLIIGLVVILVLGVL